jgi:MFS family permease
VSYIDGSVVNVALPSIQNSLGTNLATMQWVINGYLLTLASLILLGGRNHDRAWSTAWRLAGRHHWVALDLLHQPADRGGSALPWEQAGG